MFNDGVSHICAPENRAAVRKEKKKKKVWLMLTKAKMGHFKLKKSFLTFHFIEFSFHQLQNKQLLLG